MHQVGKFFEDESKWCKGAIARNKEGVALDNPHSPDAVQWCLYGALCKLKLWDLIGTIRERTHGLSIAAYNDTYGYSGVMEILN